MRDPKRDSTHMQNRVESVAAELLKGGLRIEAGKSTLLRTRKDLERGWRAVSDILVRERQPELASQVERFVDQMSPPLTEKEQLAGALREQARIPRARDQSPTR